jgi:N-sulfoglucosamine sulfohydrolase
VIVPSHLPDIPEVREKLSKYYMSMQRADKGLERIIEILKESGKWDNTIILFTSDNGRPFVGAKSNLYEPGIRLPFVFRDPGQEKKGIATDAMVSFTDIAPTLLDYAGVEPGTYPMHGRSFRAQVGQEQSTGFDEVYASHSLHEIQMYYPMRMVRDRKYKLIWNLAYEQTFPLGGGSSAFARFIERNELKTIGKRTVKDYLQRPQFELYDLENDPDEVNNLAYQEEYREVFEIYREKLYGFQEETGDIWKVYRDYEKVKGLIN